ncbi:MAG: thioredoxin [Pygmaiobacter massiliensis]|uniref:thioredoxin n=1 Tax=Pygmaiobacter massiliensis TaxID=1917873 RepID=UPI002898C43C|nr:thioredoxin [Pygmaiobacter massiliensis]
MDILKITKENFSAAVQNAERPILLDFWAPWCVYCRRIAPVLDKIAEEYASKLTVAKLNIDDAPELAEQFGVQTIPTLLLFQKGAHGEGIIAPESKAKIEEWLAQQGLEK